MAMFFNELPGSAHIGGDRDEELAAVAALLLLAVLERSILIDIRDTRLFSVDLVDLCLVP